MKKIYQNTLFYIVIFCITYFIYVYPFEILNELIFSENVNRRSSFYYTIIISILIIFYFRSYQSLKPLKIFIYEGMGIGFISFWIVNLALIFDYFFSFNKINLAYSIIIIIITLTIFSIYFGSKIYIKKIILNSNKVKSDKSFIFISDIHLGSNSTKHLKKLINKINKINFDFILIGGDIIDSSSYNINELKLFEKITKPIFFVTGNHEYYIKNSELKIKTINKFSINHISNDNILLDDINIIGVNDNLKKNNQIEIVNKNSKVNLFNILLIHKPSIWQNVLNKSDLMLSGHTHNGQIFPFNLFVKIQFKQNYGLYKKSKSHLYVTSGSGCWGPRMRLGTFNEIVHIELKSDKIV